ncbi:large ribosomal subunit protein mL48 [Anabrus simplex]|uniref:large ribosomal subunit protein mL48 n=1 Tax=Anabrus simplex TaxID=316456 RepID=UPI0034DCC83D
MFRYIHHRSALLCQKVTRMCRLNQNFPKYYSIYEPDYLETGKSKIPVYDTLNIQIKGYDYPVLENYQRFVYKIATSMGVEVEDGWATPPQNLKILRYKPQSTITDSEYKLSIYERNIQIVDVPNTLLSVLLEVLKTSLPEGVTLRVHEHLPEHEEIRYVPDNELIELKNLLESLSIQKKK